MTDVRGCNIPEELYYWVEKHVWVRDDGDDVVTVGITDVAQHLANRVVAVTTKRPGKLLERGQSVATVESGKWVGPVPTPINGEGLERVANPRGREPGFLEEFRREITLVAFDLLLYHLQASHAELVGLPAIPVDEPPPGETR